MEVPRLLILDPPELILRFEVGRKSIGVLVIRNVMDTVPVAFKIKTSAPKLYTIKPPHAVIRPSGVMSVKIVRHSQADLPLTFPNCPEKFTVKSVVAPGASNSKIKCAFSVDWFTSKKAEAVYTDTSLRIVLVGGGILRTLIATGRMDDVKRVLEGDTSVAEAAGDRGEMSMHVAISTGRPELVQLLLLFKVTTELENTSGQTPLLQAAHAGDALITELLLANGAKLEATDTAGWTALHHATVKGHVEILRLLIQYGADLDAAADDGRTAVHIAVAEGHLRCLQLLLEKGCNVNARSKDGETPLHTASARGHVAFVQLMLEHGANTDVINAQGRTPYDEAADSSHSVLFDMLYLGDRLRQSARKGELQQVKEYVRHGAVIDGVDQRGWTALHQAAFKGRVDVVKFLVERGADLERQDEEGYTALHVAVEACQKDIVELLLQFGARVNETTTRGVTPFDLAKTQEYVGIIGLLVEAGGLGDYALSTGDNNDCHDTVPEFSKSPCVRDNTSGRWGGMGSSCGNFIKEEIGIWC